MSFSRGFLSLGLLFAVTAPTPAQQRWTLTEEIRLGSLDEGPAMFSDVRGFVVQRGGDVWVLDYKTQDIRIFDASGKFKKTVGRAGSGPGEMRTANGMLLAPDGRVWVNDPGNSRFSVFDSEGRHVANHVIPINSYGFIWDAMIDTAGVIHEPAFFPAPGSEGKRAIRRVRPTGEVLDTIPLLSCGRVRPPEERIFQARSARGGRMSQIPFVSAPVSAWDPAGYLWCAMSGEYDVVRLRLGRGDTARRITRAVKPLPVSDGERDAEIERVKEMFKDYPGADLDFSRIPRVKPVLMSLHLDDRGFLWVRRTTADTTVSAFDVFDRAGSQIASVEARFAPSRFHKPVIRGDQFYALVRDEDDVPYILRARIVRPRGP
jgi:hypothetical protein